MPHSQGFSFTATFRSQKLSGRTNTLTVWLAIGFFLVANLLTVAQDFQTDLEQVLNAPRFKHAHWGLLFVDAKTGEIVFERNADHLFAPASTTKLYSVASAMDALGADHRFTTPVHRRGEIDATGELRGDLILVASGDLSMGGRTTANGEIAFTNSDHTYANGSADGELTTPDPLAGLDQLAKQIAASGVKRVRGNVLIDDRLFEKAEGSGSGPQRITPIMINDNVLDITFAPTTPGQPANITWRPQTAAFQIDVRVDTVEKDGGLETWIRDLGNGRLQIHGRIPVGHKPVLRVYEVPDATSFARTLFIEALDRAGVIVSASKLSENDSQTLPSRSDVVALPVVAKLQSPPFSESARLVLKVSHNLQASTLPLLVAAKHGERSLRDGLKRQHDFLARAGVDVETISFGGGAGGARADFVTPRATVQLLKYMQSRPDFPDYQRALPLIGIDGTLSKSVDGNSPARGKVQAKTGTLMWDNVMNGNSLLTSKALAGYLTTNQDRQLIFALFVNNAHLRDGVTTATVGRDLGKICEVVHRHF